MPGYHPVQVGQHGLEPAALLRGLGRQAGSNGARSQLGQHRPRLDAVVVVGDRLDDLIAVPANSSGLMCALTPAI